VLASRGKATLRPFLLALGLTLAAPARGEEGLGAPRSDIEEEKARPKTVPFGEPEPPAGGFPWKKTGSVAIVGAIYGTAWTWVSAAWWTRKNASKGFVFLDEGAFGLDTYAGGSDKLGHYYANYLMNRGFAGILEWGGFTRTGSIVSSTLLTTAFFSAVEVKDAYHLNYGFSAGDIIANLAGQGTALALMLSPSLDEAISVKLQYFPSSDFFHALSTEGPLNTPEDYTGQTFLLSYHLASLPLVKQTPSLGLLRYVDLSLGYGTRNFKPVPKTPTPVKTLLSLGFSLNFQAMFDDLMLDEGETPGAGDQVVHFTNEVYQPPYTRLPFFTWERVGGPTKAD
jgi:hypothetical protein